jgi:alanine racemase
MPRLCDLVSKVRRLYHGGSLPTPHRTMPRPILATIHTDALRHNLARARQAAPDAKVWAVVKANAYGHGIERVFEGLRAADGFAMLDLSTRPSACARWAGAARCCCSKAFSRRVTWSCARVWACGTPSTATHRSTCWPRTRPTCGHRVFLKMNSGMNRLGFPPHRYRAAWTRLNALPQVEEISLMTHFSDADGPRGMAHQLAVFNDATRDLPGERSVSNSAAACATWAPASRQAARWCRTGSAPASSPMAVRRTTRSTTHTPGACSRR